MSTETQKVEVTAQVQVAVTPELMAALFWEMDTVQQADFFAELERLAGVNLCFQMAGVVREIQERADRGDFLAQTGFQTMLSHAQHYCEGATDYRHWSAKSEIERMAREAKNRIGSPS